jgi:cell division initiation protein
MPMDLTAREVHEKQFHDAWRGYNQEEVDDFLDEVAEVLDDLRRENESLRSRVSDLEHVVTQSRDTEAMLKKTLVSAQEAAENALKNAKARAEKLITEADERVKRANEEARERVKSANEEARERIHAAEEEARERVQAAEEEAKQKSADAERRHAEKTKALHTSIEELSLYEKDLKQRLRVFLQDELKSLEALTEKASATQARAPDGQPKSEPASNEPRTGPQRLHAAPATSYRERENARPSQRQQPEPHTARAQPSDESPDPTVRRRRPAEEPHHRRGLRGFFWGGDQG